MKIMTFNIKNNIALKCSKSYYKKRIKHIVSIIKKESPDIIGLEECSQNMLKLLKQNLNDYQFITNSRNTYENDNLILVNVKIKVISKGIFYLSEDKYLKNSKYLMSVQARNCTYVIVSINNFKLAFYNTHLDFLFNFIREKQLNVIKNTLKKMPVILVGDFNMGYGKIMKDFEKETNLKNITKNIGRTMIKRRIPLDHIFISKNFKINKVYKCENKLASDHYAVIADLTIN